MNYSSLKDYIQLMNEKKNDIETTIKKDTADVLVVEKNIKELKEHMKNLKQNIKENEENMILLQKTISETETEFEKIVKSTNTLLNTVKEKHLPKFKIMVDTNTNVNDNDNDNQTTSDDSVSINNEVANEIESYKQNKSVSDNTSNEKNSDLPSLFSNKKLKKVELLQQ